MHAPPNCVREVSSRVLGAVVAVFPVPVEDAKEMIVLQAVHAGLDQQGVLVRFAVRIFRGHVPLGDVAHHQAEAGADGELLAVGPFGSLFHPELESLPMKERRGAALERTRRARVCVRAVEAVPQGFDTVAVTLAVTFAPPHPHTHARQEEAGKGRCLGMLGALSGSLGEPQPRKLCPEL